MSKSNNIPVWTDGNNLVDSGISLSSLGGSGTVSDSGLKTSFSGGTEIINHSLGKIPKIINFNGVGIANSSIITTTYGNYCNGTNKSIFNTIISSANEGRTNMETSTTYCFYVNCTLPTYPNNYIRSYVSNVSASNFTLINDISSASLSLGVIWNAIA